jgi:starch-binding outer membrane protein, SusD/RagB family
MKKINNFLFSYAKQLMVSAVLIWSFNSCSKSFLDVPPQGRATASTVFNDSGDALEALNAVYANMRGWSMCAFSSYAIENLTSDDATKGSTPGDAAFMNLYVNFQMTSTEGEISDYWNGKYQEIDLCNYAIDSIPGIKMDTALRSRLIGEAKFVRAYCYFQLVKAFGDVVLRLHPMPVLIDSTLLLPRSSKALVYTAIQNDLAAAAAVLPVSYGPADAGRATKGAALALNAKVSLFLQQWQDVLTYTHQVMNLGYSLYPNFEKMFRAEGKNCSESIFEVQSYDLEGNPGAAGSYAQPQGPRNVTWVWGSGWGFNNPSPDLESAFEPGDTRLAGTILYRGKTTPEGDFVDTAATNPMYNMKAYEPTSEPQTTGYGVGQNQRILRYAEVLLMDAEAANELGNSTEALSYLNQVRARARGGNPTVLPDVTTTDQAALRNAIYHERRVELAMEGDRFFDLVRTGQAATVLNSKGFTAGKNEVMPIPQTEIDLSGGIITQNKGY